MLSYHTPQDAERQDRICTLSEPEFYYFPTSPLTGTGCYCFEICFMIGLCNLREGKKELACTFSSQAEVRNWTNPYFTYSVGSIMYQHLKSEVACDNRLCSLSSSPMSLVKQLLSS